MSEPVRLSAVLGTYAHTKPLKSGALSSPEARLDFTEIAPVHRAFGPMVERGAFDLCELAVVTALQAIAFARPIMLLPAVVAARAQRGCLISHAPRGPIAPASLATRKIGVRAYTQTTGMWVRAHLAEDFDLPIERMHWVTQEAAHVSDFHDPPCVLAGPDKPLVAMLRDGDIDAAILGNDLPEGDEFIPVVTDAAARDRAWSAANGFTPINHLVVVRSDIAREHPEAVRAAYGLLVAAAAAAPGPTRFGAAALARPLQITIDTCVRQLLLPRRLDAEALLAPAAALLGQA